MRRSALAEAGPLLDPTAVETERRVVWLRVAAVPILAAGQSLPHPNPEPTAFYTALGVFAALAALAVFWIYTRPATRGFVLATIALDVAAFTALAFLSGGAFSPAWLAFFFVPLSVAFRVRPALTAAAGAAVLVAFLSQALTLARQRLMVDSLAAEQRERKLLAENLHDHAIQNLLSARHELEEAAETSPHPALDRADRALADTVAELREAIFELHPYVLEEAGLEAALRAAAERAERLGGFRVRCDLRYPRRHPHEDVLYSAARQLLANAAEHSGARAVDVRLSQLGDAIVLAVEDDGQGFDAGILTERVAEGHVGLASQRERVESVGGRLELLSSPGRGTKVTVSVPGVAIPLAVPDRSLDPQTPR